MPEGGNRAASLRGFRRRAETMPGSAFPTTGPTRGYATAGARAGHPPHPVAVPRDL